jgi:hypothetical protein
MATSSPLGSIRVTSQVFTAMRHGVRSILIPVSKAKGQAIAQRLTLGGTTTVALRINSVASSVLGVAAP